MNKPKVTVVIPVYNQQELLIRAIDSVPKRGDIEIIVIDDGSTDKTWDNLIKYREEHQEILNLVCLYNDENMGVAYTVNRGIDFAKGEYIVLLGSDDYFYTDKFEECLKYLDGKTDLIYFNLETNNGTIYKVTQENKTYYCGSVKFMRKDFIGSTRCPENMKSGEDYVFFQELLEKKPTEIFTDMIVKHYNFPREGSLTDGALKGESRFYEKN